MGSKICNPFVVPVIAKNAIAAIFGLSDISAKGAIALFQRQWLMQVMFNPALLIRF